MKKLVCLGLVAAMVVSLAACGSSNTKSTESKATESAAASESSADQAEAASGLKIALVMSGAANDQGWNQTAYEGTQKACEKYGCELAYTENVSTADIAAVFADYAGSGYDIVIGHGYEFGDPALEVAATYPDTKFICTEADAAADNVASYVMACEQTAYVEGINRSIHDKIRQDRCHRTNSWRFTCEKLSTVMKTVLKLSIRISMCRQHGQIHS